MKSHQVDLLVKDPISSISKALTAISKDASGRYANVGGSRYFDLLEKWQPSPLFRLNFCDHIAARQNRTWFILDV